MNTKLRCIWNITQSGRHNTRLWSCITDLVQCHSFQMWVLPISQM